MLKLELTEIYGWEAAIRGMRNPLNSWDKSDSNFSCRDCEGCYYAYDAKTEIEADCSVTNWCEHTALRLGENDLSLMRKLAKAGSDHRKYLRQIFVSVDITAPLYWWKEFDTYKVGTVANSCSTMHKLHAKAFTREDFSCDRMTDKALAVLDGVIDCLEEERQRFVETKALDAWHNMIQLLPTSYMQLRTVTLNYEVLINIYYARRQHKLAEWHTLCDWIRELPYSELITGGETADEN